MDASRSIASEGGNILPALEKCTAIFELPYTPILSKRHVDERLWHSI